MSDQRLVMALLEEGNPATDVGDDWSEVNAATYLATLERKGSEMTQSETKKSQKDSRRSTTRWLVAAISVIVLGVAVVVNQGGVPAIPLEGADGDPQAVENFKAVEEAYYMFNTGDPAWMEVRNRGSQGAFEEPDAAGLAAWEAEHRAANAHFEVSGCVSQGYGEWPDLVDSGVPAPTGYYFICDTTETNSLWDVGGTQLSGSYNWVVSNGTVVAVNNTENADEVIGFMEAFQKWLEDNHPDIAADVIPFLSDPEMVPKTIESAKDFVAQSDIYPIENGGS